jgi:predicted O-methyltransferase YrrM
MTDLEILEAGTAAKGAIYCKPYLRMKLSEPPRFGLKTRGLEYILSNAMYAATQGTQGKAFTLLEIGTATGESTRAFYQVMKDNPAFFAPFHLVSCDLPDGWSLSTASVVKNIPDARIYFELAEYDAGNGINDVSVILQSSHDILASWKIPQINFAFIDGCHGYNCVAQDWRDVDALMPVGGIVVFHDADPQCQGQDIQPHCMEPIRVREAVTDGLRRTAGKWKLLADIHADPDNNGVIILQKVE